MKKIFCLIMASVMTLGLVACKSPESSEESSKEEQIVLQESENVLLKDGKTEYGLLIDADNNDAIYTYAVDEFVTLFQMVTNQKITVVSDENQNDGKYISLGKTKLYDAKIGESYNAELKNSGCSLTVKDDDLFLYGNGSYGILNSVYVFMEKQFGFEVYAADEIVFHKASKTMKLLNFELEVAPDFDWRIQNNGELNVDKDYCRRLRLQYTSDLWTSMNGAIHNSLDVVPREENETAHPNWYSEGTKEQHQLCYSRDVPGLSDYVLEKIKEIVENNPTATDICFTQADGAEWCRCTQCADSFKKYGTDSAVLVRFMNVLAEKLETWLTQEHSNRDIKLTFFAYCKSEQAPVRQDANGKYVPMEEDLKLHEDLVVFLAPINAYWYHSLKNPTNESTLKTLEKWAAISKTVYAWFYSVNYHHYLVPYDNLNACQENYQIAKTNNVDMIYDLQQWNNPIAPDFSRLKMYIYSKLLWDVNADVVALTNNWFNNYFRDAAPIMKQFYEEEKLWYSHLINGSQILSSYVYENALGGNRVSETWPKAMVNKWNGYIDKAYQAIDYLQTENPDLYATLQERIELESVTIKNLLVHLNDDDKNLYLDDLMSSCKKLGITRYSETILLNDFYNSTLIK